jgi:hypothetical protein
MDGAFNAGWQAGTQVKVATCRRGLIADQENQRLGPKTPPDFSDAHGTSSRLFV